MAKGTGTNGGQGGPGGSGIRGLVVLLATGFLLILVLVMIANAESTLSDFAAAGIRETGLHVWIWEITSIIAWITAMPAIWWMVARFRPPRRSWAVIALVVVLASVPFSLWHIGLMVALRKVAYAALGEHYRFFGIIGDRLLYEYRKDVASYMQFAGLAAIAQWLITRARQVETVRPPGMPLLAVPDGAVTHQVPMAEIGWVAAAGNYVEIGWCDRTLLHRTTLATMAEQLGDDFVRIHRSRLVRRDAIRRVETERSGDFTVELEGGTRLRGSRRFRELVRSSPGR